MATSIRSCLAVLALAAWLLTQSAGAADYYATQSGSWSTASTWATDGTPGTTPGSNDYVTIGYNSNGAILSPTVTLTQSQSTYQIVMGAANGSSPTLNLDGQNLSAVSIYFGYTSGATCTLQRTGGGSLTISDILQVDHGNSLALATGDTINALVVNNGSAVSTAAVGNISNYIDVSSGTLSLGANLTTTGYVQLDTGTLNMNSHAITTPTLYLGYPNGSTPNVQNKGQLNISSTLYLGYTSLTLGASDTIYSASIFNGASLTTAATGNLTGNVTVSGNGKLTLGANLNVGNNSVDIQAATFNMAGYSLAANTLNLGYNAGPAVLQNRGPIAVTNLNIGNLAFNISSSDSVANFTLTGSTASTSLASGITVTNLTLNNGATATLATSGNVTYGLSINNSQVAATAGLSLSVVDITAGGSLSVGGDISAPSYVELDTGTLNMNGHNLTTGTLYLGYYSGNMPVFQNQGKLTLGSLSLGNVPLTLGSSDTVTSTVNVFNGASLTTTATGNLTGNVAVYTGAKLTLGANLSVGSNDIVDIQAATLDMGSHSLTAGQLNIGYNAGPATLLNRGPIAVTYLYIGQSFNISTADSVTNFYVNGTSTSTALATGTSVTNLTLTNGATATAATVGNITGSVYIQSGSQLTTTAGLTLSNYVNITGGASLTVGGDISAPNYVELDTGTLNMNGHNITTQTLYIGYYSGNTPVLQNKGQLSIGTLYLGNTTLTLGASDTISSSAQVYNGATLALAANLSMTGTFDLRDATLNMAGFALTANQFNFGYNGGPSTLLNRGTLNVTNLYLGQSFNLLATDTVTNFYLTGASTATTLPSGLSLGTLTVQNGASATLGADLTLTGGNGVRVDTGTLNLGTHTLTASYGYFGYYTGTPTITGTGNLAIGNLYLANIALTLSPGSSVGNLTLVGVSGDSTSLTTSATGNVTTSVTLYGSNNSTGVTLTLGADMTLTGDFDIQDATLNMANHKITANNFYFNYHGGPSILQNKGQLAVSSLYIGNSTLNLGAADTIGSLTLQNGAAVTTAAAGNLTGSVYLSISGSASTLNLGANLNLSGSFRIDQGTFNAGGHNVTVPTIFFGYYGNQTVTVQNLGAVVSSTSVYVGNGTSITLASGADQINYFNLSNGSQVKVVRSAIVGSTGGTGLSLTNSNAGNGTLAIDGTSKLILEFPDDLSTGGWALRWANPVSGDHVAEINALINSGQITFQFDSTVFTPLVQSLPDGYTYVGTPTPSPEPSLLLLGAVPLAVWFVRRR